MAGGKKDSTSSRPVESQPESQGFSSYIKILKEIHAVPSVIDAAERTAKNEKNRRDK